VKNAVKDANGKIVWSPVDIGYVDWTAQFKALKDMGYSHATNLETHWRGGGTPEQSTRISWAGMKKCLQAGGRDLELARSGWMVAHSIPPSSDSAGGGDKGCLPSEVRGEQRRE
jgi:hypothetical protein